MVTVPITVKVTGSNPTLGQLAAGNLSTQQLMGTFLNQGRVRHGKERKGRSLDKRVCLVVIMDDFC